MKKIIVIGCAGSGKSYFASRLSKIINIKKYHLDCYFWKENWQKMPDEEFVKIVDKIMEEDCWIIDGNYSKTMERRMIKADTIFFLDMPTELCLESERKRRGSKREDLPDYLIEPLEEDKEFIEFIRNYNINRRPIVLSLLEKYKDKNIIIFTSRDQVDEYLNAFEKNSTI